ncbi:MAG: heme lyase CcmF/NrfE family subunit [Gammaproteobacteria bacterium]
MIPEIGQTALIIAALLAMCQAVFCFGGSLRNDTGWLAAGRSAAIGNMVFCVTAFGVLISAFVANDFSVQYVATNSNSALPTYYRVAAVWGGHEGSLLLWITVQSIWTAAVAATAGRLPPRFGGKVLGVLALVGLGFLLFTLYTSNPFLRFPVPPADGRDLNPLLQDFGLTVHPPMLYMGYVGLSVAFAFSVASMLEGRLDPKWAKWTRPWTMLAWMFLTCGIALGSWWAYYELGWGGWWFWDPVENASFMPWLVATALIHSLSVTEKRGLFQGWTILLGVSGFALSLLGTFLVRSGVLVSVHSFASDPERGVFILVLFGIAVLGSLILYAVRADRFRSQAQFDLLSRETALLLNNLLLVVAAAAILYGTLYPLIIDYLELPKLSVGPQWFNAYFVPLTLLVSASMGVGMHLAWRRSPGGALKGRLTGALILAVALGVALPWMAYGRTGLMIVVGVTAAGWTALSVLSEPWRRWRAGQSLLMPAPVVGMLIAHFGVALTILGVTLTSSYGIATDNALSPGETMDIAGYTVRLDGVSAVSGPNYEAQRGTLTVTRNGKTVATLLPEKRRYRVQTSPMTEAAIDAGLTRDLFIAMGSPLGDGAWSVRVQYKPYIRFIWLGAVVMAFGGGVAMFGRRRVRADKPQAQGAATAVGA